MSEIGEGIQRPDTVGFACDGFESAVANPFASGWQWVGPGVRPPGLRDKARRHKAALRARTAPTHTAHAPDCARAVLCRRRW